VNQSSRARISHSALSAGRGKLREQLRGRFNLVEKDLFYVLFLSALGHEKASLNIRKIVYILVQVENPEC
jgi:hypothetical protein